jgi:hypothetical protein
MLLKNVTIRYAKLNPDRPDKKMVKEGRWSLQMITRSREQAKEWKDAQIKTKMDEDEEGVYWVANLGKRATKADGSPAAPIEVVNGSKVAIDPNSLGNGSICNIKIYQRPYVNKETGANMIQNMLTGVQVKVHKVYVPRVYEEFEDEGETTTYMPEGSTTDDDDDDIAF